MQCMIGEIYAQGQFFNSARLVTCKRAIDAAIKSREKWFIPMLWGDSLPSKHLFCKRLPQSLPEHLPYHLAKGRRGGLSRFTRERPLPGVGFSPWVPQTSVSIPNRSQSSYVSLTLCTTISRAPDSRVRTPRLGGQVPQTLEDNNKGYVCVYVFQIQWKSMQVQLCCVHTDRQQEATIALPQSCTQTHMCKEQVFRKQQCERSWIFDHSEVAFSAGF